MKTRTNKIKWGRSNTYVHLSPTEVRSLLGAGMEGSTRNWLMMAVMYLHGLRVSELLSLTSADIQGDNLRVQRLKDGFLNIQPLHVDQDPLLSEAGPLKALALARPGNMRLFDITRFQVFRIVQGYCQALGFAEQKCHPHVLRHSIAMHSIGTAGIHSVKQWLGHKSITSTMQYLRSTDADAATKIFACVKGKQ